ncbi:MAG: hypothetical protein Q7N50_06600 [Armatimonadota bacterium]|nr:hypothetical protein [Armatimonadota bacterium]
MNLLDYSLQPSSYPDHDAIRTHLDGCEECRRVLDQERRLAMSLNSLGMVSPKSDMWPVVRDRIRVKTPAWRGVVPWMVLSNARRFAAAGAAVVAMTAVVFIGVSENSKYEEKAAVSHLVEIQQQSQASNSWADDPLGVTSDRVLAALEEGS